ncbi:inovirus Gp2 family protein [Shewanella sp. HL-SH8]|uniref:inovirus Gp2 family protein n=1 Tax=Shewanella sp. HL-SH8 TaxID=3436242 RepID=UPI003EBB6C08
MSTRHTANTNLNVIDNGLLHGLSVYPKPLCVEYLEAILNTFQAALNEHPRTFMVRFDLHLPRVMSIPDSPLQFESNVISKFFKSLDAKIDNDREFKRREGKRVHPCQLRYVWARERKDAELDHYHVVIFLNNDAYSHLGNFNTFGPNISSKIVESWASALYLDDYSTGRLVHFPENKPVYYLNKNGSNYQQVFNEALYRLSYFAKLDTKHYGDRSRSFGCSSYRLKY